MTFRWTVVSGGLLVLLLFWGCRDSSSTEQTSIEATVAAAKAELAKEDPKAAIRLLEEYIRKWGSDANVTEILARAYGQNQDDELAAFYFEQTASLSELKYYCYLDAAEHYEHLNDGDRACFCYQAYLKILPEDSEVQLKYANMLLKKGEKKEALDRLVRYTKGDVATQLQIASLFFEWDNYTQARNAYLSILEAEPNNLVALKGLWRIYSVLEDYSEMIKVGEQLVSLGCTNIRGANPADFIRYNREFQQELRELNDNDFCTFEIPVIVIEDILVPGEVKEQEKPLTKRRTKKEQAVRLKEAIAKAKKQGNYEQAIENLWKLLGIDGKNIRAWTELTECLEKANKYSVAEMAIQEAMKLQPNDPDLRIRYLGIILRTQDTTAYAKTVKEAKRQFPSNADIRLLWAKVQETYLGDVNGARRSYKKFLQMAPLGHSEINRVENLLKAYQG